MTEEEAKTKWCPFVRVAGVDGPDRGAEWHTNRPSVADVESKGFDLCCGSACMAWRWSGQRGNLVREQRMSGTDVPDPIDGHEWHMGDKEESGRNWGLFSKRGFCGLAGRPE